MGDRSATIAVAAELEAAADAATPPPAEQLDFLPSRFTGPDDAPEHALQVARVRQNRRGRPAGSQNVATKDMLTFCRRVFGDPVMETFRWAQHTPESLARELGCTKLEAFDRLDAIRARLEKLFYAARAPVDGDGNAIAPSFTLTIGGQSADQDQRPPWLRQHEQNQGFIDVSPPVSHAVKSHGDDK